MSITQQHTQELLHRAYVLAVAADAGLNITLGSELDYGVDITISPVTEIADARGTISLVEAGPSLKVQLKSTTGCRSDATHVRYDCEAKAYNRMVIQNQHLTAPVLLVVLCLPPSREGWLTVSEDVLTIRNACYWYFLTGPQTKKTSQVIRIPRAQLLSPIALRGIMDRIASGGAP